MYHIRLIAASELDSFEGMVVKAFRERILNSPSSLDLILIGVELFDKKIGLLTASVEDDNVFIHSIFVAFRYRNMGIGTKLMDRLKEEVKQWGLKSIAAEFSEQSKAKAFFEHLIRLYSEEEIVLEKQGVNFTLNFEHTAEADWVRRSSLPPLFTPIKWHQASTEMLEHIRQGKGEWYPDWADPSRYESRMQMDTSWILCNGREPIGWLIYQEKQEEARKLVCSVLFTRKEYESRGRSVHLLAESFRIAYALGYQQAYFCVRADNPNMLRFTSKRLEPFLVNKEVILQYSDKSGELARKAI